MNQNTAKYSKQVIDYFKSGEADDGDWEKLRQFIETALFTSSNIQGQMIDLIDETKPKWSSP